MIKRILILATLFLLLAFQNAFSQSLINSSPKKILILGSSIAAGWVTSYKEKYDMENGYAARLGRFLQPQGWEVINLSIPGFDTRNTIDRFYKDVLPLHPDYVFIGLSMSNEGLETEDPDSVLIRYTGNLKKLVRLCRENDIYPLVGLCYGNNAYSSLQYEYLKKMNIEINGWDVPSINLLGALDDGNGHFPADDIFDPGHPGNRGHEEFYFAFVPSLFEALEKRKTFKMPVADWKFLTLGSKNGLSHLSYIPDGVMHSFSFCFSFRTGNNGMIAEIRTRTGSVQIFLDETGNLVCRTRAQEIITKQRTEKNTWHQVVITHGYLVKKTILFLDGILQGEIMDQIEPLAFLLGNNPGNIDYKDLCIFRGALNQNEITVLKNRKQLQASLEVYSPLNDPSPFRGMRVANYAISLNSATIDPSDDDLKMSSVSAKIDSARIDRENEIKVEHKKPIPMDSSVYDNYTGQYEIAPGDYFIVEKRDGLLFFTDRGNSAELLPEATDKFFIRYPADLTVLFEMDEQKKVKGLVFSMNGREMKARKTK